ncbi:hypothetical protein LOH54_07835 [Sulfurimonas sp. HSL-3221]|uniref:hypothetical protein n=1 Tax=Thiomicrolovo sulfuroxydans TaxID=2894755 RepID=UPI001E41558F|nr:hypothetical protein [Sulfurimonas sp. HSL-3221]UFS61572.1 hypothetical protein LOH54_07835 [Sulfurimonas sp. HSL-3221]
MKKSIFAAAFLLYGSMASAVSVGVIVPYEEEEKPAPKKELTAEQKKQEAVFKERLRQRDAERERAKEAQEKFKRELLEKRLKD